MLTQYNSQNQVKTTIQWFEAERKKWSLQTVAAHLQAVKNSIDQESFVCYDPQDMGFVPGDILTALSPEASGRIELLEAYLRLVNTRGLRPEDLQNIVLEQSDIHPFSFRLNTDSTDGRKCIGSALVRNNPGMGTI